MDRHSDIRQFWRPKYSSTQYWLKRSVSTNSIPSASKDFVSSITEKTEICVPSYVCHEMKQRCFAFNVNWPGRSSVQFPVWWIFQKYILNTIKPWIINIPIRFKNIYYYYLCFQYFMNINWWPVKRLVCLLEHWGRLAVEFKTERFQFLVKILSKESFCISL